MISIGNALMKHKSIFFLVFSVLFALPCVSYSQEGGESHDEALSSASVLELISEEPVSSEGSARSDNAAVSDVAVGQDGTVPARDDAADDVASVRGAVDSSIASDDDPAASSGVSADAEDSQEGGLYPEITSQNEWYLGRKIASHKITGVRISHRGKVESIFRSYRNKVFTYELLSNLQRDLYATGYFESFNPQVDIDRNKDLTLIFDFTEIPVIRSISFIAETITDKLSYSNEELRRKTGLLIGDSRTKKEIEATARLVRDFYVEESRPDTLVSIGLFKDNQADEYNIVYTITEGAEKRVGQIVFDGNDNVPSQTLLRNMETTISSSKRNGHYLEKNFKEDIRKLSDYYRRNGYKDVEITGPASEPVYIGRDDGVQYVRLTYTIKEGRQWKYGKVSISGNTVFDDKSIASMLSFKEGEIFDYEKSRADADSILSDYYNEGYIYATIALETTENEESQSVDLNMVFNEESQCYIEKVMIEGAESTDKQVFLRELSFKEGDVFSREKVQQSFQNIYNTGLIKDMTYNLNAGTDKHHLVLELIIEEAQAMDLTFGMTFGGTEGGFPLSFTTSFNNKNFLGKANTLSAGINVTTDYQAVNFSLGSPWFKNIRWSNSFNLSFERSVKGSALQRNPDSDFQIGRNNAFPLGYSSYNDFEAYDEAVPSLRYLMKYDMYRFSFGYNTGYSWVTKYGRMSVSGGLSIGLNRASYDENEYMPFEYLIEQYRQAWRFSNRLYFGITWDGRDFIENTTKGYMVSQNFVYAGGILGGLSNYIRSVTTLSGYLMLLKTSEGIRPTALVGSYTTSVSLMLPQFYGTELDGDDTSWRWHDPKLGATRSEMLYIDGMRVARGHKTVYDISFMWDNILELSYPLVNGIVNAEVFTSMTAVSKQLENLSSNLMWYGAVGMGVKLKISGFPLGVYLVGDYKIKDGSVSWVDGGLFNYIHPVIAISTSLI
ncbi:MAG TPA: outer membrane protein assembly factor BamA [Spirochaetaceae bacterium]|nr:outer membrane protein assembly factor BamA [Spirochaetaceae bacterium]